MSGWIAMAEAPVDGVEGTTPVRPGKSRQRNPGAADDKVKQAPGGKKKAPLPRKPPSRGRYVDEYARAPN